MKKLLHFSLLLLSWSCTIDEDIPTHTLEGHFQGQYIRTSTGIWPLTDEEERKDTHFVDFTIHTSQFKRHYTDTFCLGEIQFNTDRIHFSSDDCACFCYCRPDIDCHGEILLGEYEYELINDSLFLHNEYERPDAMEAYWNTLKTEIDITLARIN
jgi:hypothetical protein